MENVLNNNSRYDKLTARQKKLRDKIERKKIKSVAQADALTSRAAKIKYKAQVKIAQWNDQLQDVVSLTENEVKRIFKKEGFDEKLVQKVYEEYRTSEYGTINPDSLCEEGKDQESEKAKEIEVNENKGDK